MGFEHSVVVQLLEAGVSKGGCGKGKGSFIHKCGPGTVQVVINLIDLVINNLSQVLLSM